MSAVPVVTWTTELGASLSVALVDGAELTDEGRAQLRGADELYRQDPGASCMVTLRPHEQPTVPRH